MTRVERQPLVWRRRPGGGHRPRVAVAARMVAALALSTLCGLMLVPFASQAVGYSAHVVISGSMAPRVQPGDVVLTRATTAAELRPGQVILFTDPGRPDGLLLHRLVAFDSAGKLVTRGDANQSDDSVHVAPTAVQGVAQVRVPWVGLPAVWRAQGRFGPIGLVAALLAAAAVVVVHPARGPRAPDGGTVRPQRVAPGSTPTLRPPMTAAGTFGVPSTAARPGPRVVHDTIPIERIIERVIEQAAQPSPPLRSPGRSEEEGSSASIAGYVLPPVPRPADGRGRTGTPRSAGRRYGRGHDRGRGHLGERVVGQPRR